MRIKEDPGAYRVSGLLKRDAQHDKSAPEVGKRGSRKDTKKWCKGKVGRHHKGEWRPYAEINHNSDPKRYVNHRILVCKGCNRHLDSCWSWFGRQCKAPNHGHAVPAVDK